MRREEKMKNVKSFAILISSIMLLSISMLSFYTYADFDENMKIFNELKPSEFINGNKNKNLDRKSIRYDEIETYIHTFNPEILNNWNIWENNKSANDVYSDYMDAYDKLYDSASSQDSDLQAGMAYAQADAMLIQADKSVNDSYIDFLTYYLREKQLVLTTKILDINYHKSQYEIQNANEALHEANRKEESATNALKYGSGTELDLLTAKKAVVDANTNILTTISSQNTYKRNFAANCGLMNLNDINILPIDLDDTFDISSIDFESDYENALNHNIQYEIYKRKRENARTDEVKNEYDIAIEAAPSNIYNDMQTKFMNILDLLNTKANREVAYSLASSNYTKANNEYKSGKISMKEFKTTEYNLLVAKNNIELVKYDLKIAIENYNASKLGFGSC